MMDHMRHMGICGKFALIAAVAALGMLVLTAITLEVAVMVTFLGLVALAYVSAVAELVVRGRRVALMATGVGSSLTVGFSLAFVSTWELAFVDQSSFLGTPLPTHDPDDYFFWAAASAIATVLILFLGVVWPSARQPRTGKRKPSPARRRPTPAARASARGSMARGAAARGTAPRTTATRNTAGQNAPAQRASGSRAPARLPAAAAKRPPSSASPARKPAPKPAPKPGTAARR